MQISRLSLLVALVVLLVTAMAMATPPHQQWTLAAARSLPTFYEDREPALEQAKADQLAAITRVVAEVSKDRAPRPPREWAALLLTIGYHESTFSLRIHRGECKPKECDAGRARSPWQLHRNQHSDEVWEKLVGLENTEVQVRAADAALRRAYHTCSRSGQPWLKATLSAYAGLRCGGTWPGQQARIDTWERLMRVGVAGGAS